MERDQKSSILGENAFDNQEIASDTTTVGEIIDSQGFESLTLLIQSGVLTDGAYVAKVEDGDDSGLSDAADVDSDLLIGSLPSFANTEDQTVKSVGYVGKKRYVRLSITSSGTTTSGFFSAVALKGHAASRPTA